MKKLKRYRYNRRAIQNGYYENRLGKCELVQDKVQWQDAMF
jgi:hypothetical protein